MYRSRTLTAFAFVAALVAARPAKAEIEFFQKDGWSISTNGRTNGFYSYEWGDKTPQGGIPNSKGSHDLVATPFEAAADAADDKKFSVSRVHGGFVGTVLGFTIRKEISPTLHASAHTELWWAIETNQFRNYSSMQVDPRVGYVMLEGTWGAVKAGRDLGLHNRGATITDFLYANGYSIGGPCNATQQGPLCGNIGYGYQFPGFNASIEYITPKLEGFQVTIGAFDPTRIGKPLELRRLPYPRIEGEATYEKKIGNISIALYGNGMWQQASDDVSGPDGVARPKKVQAWGVGYGGRLEVGKIFKIGVGGDKDAGGGDFAALADFIPLDGAAELRHTDGYFGQVMVSPGPIDVAAGAGITRILETADDVKSEKSPIKTRLGMNVSVNYHTDPVVVSAQVYHARHAFWRGEKQNLTFLHTGLTFVW
jgi:predicted porin